MQRRMHKVNLTTTDTESAKHIITPKGITMPAKCYPANKQYAMPGMSINATLHYAVH